MTITLSIRPEVEAALSRKAALAGRALETYAAELLEDAIDLPAPETPAAAQTGRRVGQNLVDAFADIRGLLTDKEIDTMFGRNPSAPALAPVEPGFGKRLVEAFAPARGLLTAEEVDTIFRREPAADRTGPLEK